MARRRYLSPLLAGGLLGLAAACAAEPSDDTTTSCSAGEPIECPSPEGKILGCCPESHPVCALSLIHISEPTRPY